MPDPSDIPPEELARFRAAEDRLYPLAMADPERYQRGVALCSLLLEDLRASCPDVAAVLQHRSALNEHLLRRAETTGFGLGGFAPETLVDAACAIRCRELQAESARAEELARVTAAREAGQEWLVEGPDPTEVIAGFYRRVEVHLPTGTRLVTSMEADGGGRTRYLLEMVPGDAAAGRGLEGRSQRFEDRADWQRASEQCRSEISAVT